MKKPEHVPLKQLSPVRTGYSFRQRVENDPVGTVSVIQLKDLKEHYSAIDEGGLTKVSDAGIHPKHFLQPGDVLLIGKGQNNLAVVYDLGLSKAIAASAFFVLTPDVSVVDPYYLAWWIGQKPVQEYFHQYTAGTHVPSLNRSVVEQIQVPLLPLAQQRLMAGVHALALAEDRILSELQEKRRMVVDQLLHSAIQQTEQ